MCGRGEERCAFCAFVASASKRTASQRPRRLTSPRHGAEEHPKWPVRRDARAAVARRTSTAPPSVHTAWNLPCTALPATRCRGRARRTGCWRYGWCCQKTPVKRQAHVGVLHWMFSCRPACHALRTASPAALAGGRCRELVASGQRRPGQQDARARDRCTARTVPELLVLVALMLSHYRRSTIPPVKAAKPAKVRAGRVKACGNGRRASSRLCLSCIARMLARAVARRCSSEC